MISPNKYFHNVVFKLSIWSHICTETEQNSRLTPVIGNLKATLYDELKRAGRDTLNALYRCVFEATDPWAWLF